MIVQAESIMCEKEQRLKNGLSREQPDMMPVPCPLESQNVSYTQKILKICSTSHGIDGEGEVRRGSGMPHGLAVTKVIQSEFLLSSTKFSPYAMHWAGPGDTASALKGCTHRSRTGRGSNSPDAWHRGREHQWDRWPPWVRAGSVTRHPMKCDGGDMVPGLGRNPKKAWGFCDFPSES